MDGMLGGEDVSSHELHSQTYTPNHPLHPHPQPHTTTHTCSHARTQKRTHICMHAQRGRKRELPLFDDSPLISIKHVPRQPIVGSAINVHPARCHCIAPSYCQSALRIEWFSGRSLNQASRRAACPLSHLQPPSSTLRLSIPLIATVLCRSTPAYPPRVPLHKRACVFARCACSVTQQAVGCGLMHQARSLGEKGVGQEAAHAGRARLLMKSRPLMYAVMEISPKPVSTGVPSLCPPAAPATSTSHLILHKEI